ncbi:MAG: glycosyltransferase family 2 protein [Candidatus Coatesbacteria bacterium]|nr:glycosyltransferase family 2 protein [Candidatus Coatesbacteria bacterium]
MGTHPDISVIIVSYNSAAYIVRCIESLVAASEDVQFEVILVDNASIDDTPKVAAERFGETSWFNLIESKQNLGFGKACNLGVERACGEYVLLLNPDVFLLPGALRALLDDVSHLDGFGAAMGRTFWDDSLEFQVSSLKELSPLASVVQMTTIRRFLGGIFEDLWEMDWAMWGSEEPFEVMGVPGGFMLMPTDLFRTLAGFDNRFFMYFEDNDLCLRIRKAGRKIFCLPNAGAIHYCGQSLRNYTGQMAMVQEQSLLSFYKKHFPVLGRLLLVAIRADKMARTAAKCLLGLLAGKGSSSEVPVGGPDGIELKWESIPGAEYYYLEVTQDPCFLHRVGARVTGISYLLRHKAYQMLNSDVYFWRAVPMRGTCRAGRIQSGRFRITGDLVKRGILGNAK